MTLLVLLVALAAPRVLAASTGCLESKPPPKTLDRLRACHKKYRAAAVRRAERAGKPLDDDAYEALYETCREEARRFLAAKDAKGDASDGGAKNALGGAAPRDLTRLDAKSAAAVTALQLRLQAAAGDGRDGVTPAMADDIRRVLNEAQGGISPDMAELLDAVSRDGGTLAPGTMQKLQGAGRAAKAEDLDLGIDAKLQQELLQHDFGRDEPAPPAERPGS